MKKALPWLSIAVAGVTLTVSLATGAIANGRPWSVVPILKLPQFGAVTNAQLADGAWWRLATAQFVHVRPAHMLLNVVSLFLIAMAVERALGGLPTFVVWLVGGAAGTYASIYGVPPPYDVGSGASQAVMSLAGAATIVLINSPHRPRWLVACLLITVALAAGLDLRAASTIKAGHVVGIVTGAVLGLVFRFGLNPELKVQTASRGEQVSRD